MLLSSLVNTQGLPTSLETGITEGFLLSYNQSRAHDSTASENNSYPSYTTPRYTKMTHTSSLYSRYSVMSDSTRPSYAVMSDTTLFHTAALNGTILANRTILNTGPTLKFTSNTGQPYTLANPLDTMMSNTGSTHQTKTNTGQPYHPSIIYAVKSTVSGNQTKANISPTRSKGICNCGRSGRGDLCVQNTIAQSLIFSAFRLQYNVSSNT